MFQPVQSLEHIVFRTGMPRHFPNADTPAIQPDDLPNAGTPEEEAVFYIGSLKTQ
jgi:hypothetical protein